MRPIWLFVCGVTALDMGFAWIHRGSIGSWELNPVQRWLAVSGGILLALLLRGVTVVFAITVFRRASRPWRIVGETVVFAAHAYLLFLYLAIFIGTGV